MADKKVSALVAINTLSADDLLMVVNDPAGTPESKKVTVGNLFGNVAVSTTFLADTTFSGNTATFSANVVITGTGGVNADINDRMQVANTTLLINDRVQVANNNTALALKSTIADPTFTGLVTIPNLIVSNQIPDPATSNAVTEGATVGTIAYSNTYLYVTTDSNTIKRVALSTF
jgi:hypothetical protein